MAADQDFDKRIDRADDKKKEPVTENGAVTGESHKLREALTLAILCIDDLEEEKTEKAHTAGTFRARRQK